MIRKITHIIRKAVLICLAAFLLTSLFAQDVGGPDVELEVLKANENGTYLAKIVSNPIGADVYVDRVKVGTTTDDGLLFEVRKGVFLLELNFPKQKFAQYGFIPIKTSFYINRDGRLISDFKENFERATYYISGMELKELGRFEEAISYFDRVLPGNIKYTDARLQISDIYIARKEYQKVVEELQEVVKIPRNKYNPYFYLALGRYSYRAKNYEQALQNLKKAQLYNDKFTSETRIESMAELWYYEALVSEQLFHETENKYHLVDGINAWQRFYFWAGKKEGVVPASQLKEARIHKKYLEDTLARLESR